MKRAEITNFFWSDSHVFPLFVFCQIYHLYPSRLHISHQNKGKTDPQWKARLTDDHCTTCLFMCVGSIDCCGSLFQTLVPLRCFKASGLLSVDVSRYTTHTHTHICMHINIHSVPFLSGRCITCYHQSATAVHHKSFYLKCGRIIDLGKNRLHFSQNLNFKVSKKKESWTSNPFPNQKSVSLYILLSVC